MTLWAPIQYLRPLVRSTYVYPYIPLLIPGTQNANIASFTNTAWKIVVCRLSQVDGNSNPCELIRIIRDDDVSLQMIPGMF